jgi:hypothetical protein
MRGCYFVRVEEECLTVLLRNAGRDGKLRAQGFVNYPTSENVIGSPFPDDALKEFVMAAVASATQG